MSSPADQYFRPYLPSDSELSDAESDSQASYDSWGEQLERPPNAEPLQQESDAPNFATFARGLAQVPIKEAAGPTLASSKQEIAYSTNEYGKFRTYGTADFVDISGGQLKYAKVPQQTVIMLQSRDRDRSIFPQPTNCQLFLPRIYRDIASFSVAQINLTSAFFYFRADKENLYITILEKDRILYDPVTSQPVLSNGIPVPLKLRNAIRPGSYNITQLLAEIQQQLNRTPLFYDFINGFSDFYPQFVINGDYALNFNYPGDTYYDSVQRIYIQNPTRAQITSYYFQSQYANLSSYTIDQVRVAYYYPVLKEVLLDPETILATYNLTYPGYTVDEVRTYLIYNFTGVDDPVATQVINQNLTALDQYRILHTFRYSLVNQYVCTYDQTNNRVTIKSSRLNTSLYNLLNTQYNAYFAQQLSLYNITQAQYNALFTVNNTIVSILQSMYDYLQVALARSFAVNFGSYSRNYYAVADNTILIRNGLDASGIAVSYDPAIAPTPLNSNLFLQFQNRPPYYWQNMSNLGDVQGPSINMGSPGQTYPTGCNFPYQIYGSNIDFTRNFIDLSGTIYTDKRRKAGDILVSVEAGKYTIFKFRSAVRQTLQVESLPRQTIFRYPLYNKANPVEYPINTLFDISYSFVSPYATSNIQYNYTYGPIYNWSNLLNTTTNFGTDFNTNAAYWGTNYESLNLTNLTGRYYFFQTPTPVAPTGSNLYRYTLNVTIQASNTFASDLYAFFYHDLSALNADISGSRVESPFNYKERLTLVAGSQSNTYSFTAYANQTYYMIVRPVGTTPAPTTYRIVPWFPNGTSNTLLSFSTNFDPAADPTQPAQLSNASFAVNNDPDYIRLPITSNLWSNTNPMNDAINTIVLAGAPVIGYDISGVSNDLTDYFPIGTNTISNLDPTAVIRADPTNNAIFQFNSPYNATSNVQSYFYSGGSNRLFTSSATSVVTWQSNTLSARQYKMVNWYGTTYIASPTNKSYTTSDISPYIPPYTTNTTSNTAIGGYTYFGASNSLRLGDGVCGWTFLPSDGVWAVDRITFKSNLLSNDPNDIIQALGIFITTEVMANPTGYVNASNAVAFLVKTNTTRYAASSNLNLGFDASLGSYYTFSNVSSLVTRSNAFFTGTSQLGRQFVGDFNSYYSILPLSGLNQTLINTSNWSSIVTTLSNAQVTPIENMVGAPIPNPYSNLAYPSNTFYDGQTSIDGKQVVLSTSNTSNDPSIVQYEQSIPYVNSHMHYLITNPITSDLSGFSTWSNLPLTPSFLNAAVPKYMLLQNGNYVISPYTMYNSIVPSTPAARSFQTPAVILTADQIYPASETTSIIAVSGNATSYCFLGLSNSTLRFKTYTPATGVLSELPTNPNYTFSASNSIVQSFVFHNTNQWYLTSLNTVSTSIVVLQGDTAYTSSNTMFSYNFTANQSRLQLDPSGSTLYLSLGSSFTTLTAWSLSASSPLYVRSTGGGATINLENSVGVLPASYSQFAVSQVRGNDDLLLLSSADPLRYFRVSSIIDTGAPTLSNTGIARSSQILTAPPTQIYGGGRGSKWLTYSSSPYIQGNRNDAFDANETLNVAYQLFFPTMKIVMRKLTNSATPVTDLTNEQYPEWPHTMMFAYSNLSSLYADISGSNGRWGLESNFMVSDVSFNGFYFNSYMMNIPLYPNMNCNVNNSNDYYYLAVRGYLPTEGFQTMMRFFLPMRYDFGYVTLRDISNEVLTIAGPQGSNFSPNYSNALLSFNSNFIYTNKNFGSNALQQISGSNYTCSNFGQFLAQYAALQTQFLSNSAILTGIQSAVTSNINGFIQSNLPYILPSSALNRQRYTDPLLFSILWKSALSPKFAPLEDEWGLGWNLGFAKEDTPFSTVHTGSTFFKIQQDFVYLRLNPEFNINRVDAGGKEKYAETREPTGITNQYYCKLLLTNFGGNATTFIHNPVSFNPPLPRLTKLQFQWLFPDGTIIDNIDAEWNMTVNITEKVVSNNIPEFIPFTPADPKTGQPATLPKGFQLPKAQETVNLQTRSDAIELAREKSAFAKAAKGIQGLQEQ